MRAVLEKSRNKGSVWAKKPPVRGALVLETTGLHAEQDAILEIAAIKFQGDTVLDTFDTLIAPGRSVP